MPEGSVHVVFGATGGIGRAVVEELIGRGISVRAVSRSGGAVRGAETIAADALEPQAAADAAAGAEVVYHCVNPGYTRWPELLPQVSRSILRAAEGSGAKLVYADNLYAYGPVDGPLHEGLPEAATGRKGSTRAAVAAELIGAHRAGRARVTIGRASDYYGPHGPMSSAGESVFGRVASGKRPAWIGRLDQRHSFHFLPDLARGLATLADDERANGEVWHLPAGEPLTGQELLDLVCEAAGRPTPAKALRMSPSMLALAGVFSPLMRELRETAYQFQAPFVSDSSKFERTFGTFAATPHRDAVRQTLQWFRDRGR